MILILGAGHAGTHTALALRQQGYTGRLVLMDRDPHLPYERPPLSKAFLKGQLEEERLRFRPAQIYADQDIELRLGDEAVELNRASRTLHLASGEKLEYEVLILAMGMKARRLPLPDALSPHTYGLRTLDDARRLKALLEGPKTAPLLAIGGGFIGLEVAASARLMGWEVDLVELAPSLMGRAIMPELGARMAQLHRAQGLKLHLSAQLGEIEAGPAGLRAQINGQMGDYAGLILGIGGVPDFDFLTGSGLESAHGIPVNGQQRTQDPHIYAVGDLAISSERFLAPGLRLESVQGAHYGAKIAAAAILEKPAPRQEAPWFWTDQYDASLQMVGLMTPELSWVRRDAPDGSDAAAWFGFHADGTLAACQALNQAKPYALARKALEQGARLDDIQALATADDATLKSLLLN